MCRLGLADSGLGAQAEVASSGEMAGVRRLLVAVNF
jgi:hypothetical protein